MVKLAMKSCKTRNDARATAVIAPANLKRTYVPIGKNNNFEVFLSDDVSTPSFLLFQQRRRQLLRRRQSKRRSPWLMYFFFFSFFFLLLHAPMSATFPSRNKTNYWKRSRKLLRRWLSQGGLHWLLPPRDLLPARKASPLL